MPSFTSTHCSSMKIILHLLFLIACAVQAVHSHDCQVLHEKQKHYIRNCENEPVEILTTRCFGHCLSNHYLLYDWRLPSDNYRHIKSVNCCKPNETRFEQIVVSCQRNHRETISYPIVLSCICKSCSDECDKSY